MFYLRGFAALAPTWLLASWARRRALRDLILEFMLERVPYWSADGGGWLQVRDDWGTQESLIDQPEPLAALLQAGLRAIADAWSPRGKHFWFHSDGQIAAIIPDLVDIGVEVINRAADSDGRRAPRPRVRRPRLLLGDLDRQWVLPFGTRPRYVRRYASTASPPSAARQRRLHRPGANRGRRAAGERRGDAAGVRELRSPARPGAPAVGAER